MLKYRTFVLVTDPRDSNNAFFVNENLTAYGKNIVSEANQRRQDGTLLSVWTLNGKIFVKTLPDGSPVRVFSEDDLVNL